MLSVKTGLERLVLVTALHRPGKLFQYSAARGAQDVKRKEPL